MKSFLERWRKRRLASAFVLLATLTAAVVGGSFWAHGVRGQESQLAGADASPLRIVNSSIPPNDFTRIAKAVGPAVVNINTTTLPKAAGKSRNPHSRVMPMPQSPDDDGSDDQFQDFFNRFFGGQGQSEQGDQVQQSLGSGFIVDPKGYIITNEHVVDKADKIYVKLASDPDTTDMGRPARIIGVDKATDLAVIKIDTSTPLPTVKMGNSDNVQVGDWVEAIGSPFDLSQTVTAGIISAKNRTIEPGPGGQFQHFIQTDAAINPGNSGGPLLDMNGNVIGVNTAIYTTSAFSQSAGYEGIGFAMPSNTVVSVYNDLVGPSHKVTRGSIGIEFKQGLSGSVNRMYGFQNGVLVTKVQPGGPADKAGLKPRDIVTSIDGRPIKDGDDLVNEIASRRPGSAIRLGFMRDGQPGTPNSVQKLDTTVTIGDRDKVFAETASSEQQSSPEAASGAGETKLGLSVREAPQATAAKLKTPGVIIQSIRPGSFADLQGLEKGLVITHLNRQPIATKEAFDAAAGKLRPGDDVVLEVLDPQHPEDGINFVGGPLQ